MVGDLNTGKIKRKVDLLDVNEIYDCCVWNDGSSEKNGDKTSIIHLILSCSGSNSIIILDFYTLTVLYMKRNKLCPYNTIKMLTKIDDGTDKNYSEGLACFLGNLFPSKIVLYEYKNRNYYKNSKN